MDALSSPAKNHATGLVTIVQTRSAIGDSKKRKQTLRALGLGKIGKMRLVDMRNPSLAGMVASVADLVTIHDEHHKSRPVADLRSSVYLIERDYSDDMEAAHLFQTTGGEYVRVEADSRTLTLAWSTICSAGEAINCIGEIYPLDSKLGGNGIVHVKPKRHLHFKASDALSYACRRPDTVRAVRAVFDDLTFCWRMNTPNLGQGAKYAQLVLELDTYNKDSARMALVATATPAIKARATDIAARASRINASAKKTGAW
ncbi:50S ribosomal protein L30 [Streptomyces coeruleorubidus]|uniref:50S ribosomal protein L30 n=1 Tax=Streptomyces coeruleorubidus TaxID=116188 RepID=A0ABZ0KFP0_STRC4|nr:50S ribosomal protein L30 [Streptomyces coeruleorubidus]WOT36823.1 50S ribosomal protein L30 [Streptomyces coeruleorubidus]